MTELARFTREEVHVLADAAEMRIVVLADQRDAHGYDSAACAAARRAIGTRYGEHDT